MADLWKQLRAAFGGTKANPPPVGPIAAGSGLYKVAGELKEQIPSSVDLPKGSPEAAPARQDQAPKAPGKR